MRRQSDIIIEFLIKKDMSVRAIELAIPLPPSLNRDLIGFVWADYSGLAVEMGRQTPSFRRLLLAEIEQLYKRFRPKLKRNPELQEAFDALIRVWSKESPSMMMSNLSTPLDAMNLLANVSTKADLERLNADLQKLQDQATLIQEFRET